MRRGKLLRDGGAAAFERAEVRAPQVARPRDGRWKPTIGLLLAFVVLLPATGMAVLATSSAAVRWSQHRAASEVSRDAVRMHGLIVLRGEVTAEYVNAASISTAADLGLSPTWLSALYHVDFRAEMRRARVQVDADSTLSASAPLAADLPALRRLRLELDAGTARFSAVHTFFTKFDAHIDLLWQRRLDDARDRATTVERGGNLVSGQLGVMQATFTAFQTAFERTSFTNDLLTGKATPANVAALIAANTRYAGAVAGFSGRLGPRAAQAWHALQLDPAGRRFDAVVNRAVQVGLGGGRSPLDTDPTAYGEALIAAGRWVVDLTFVNAAASIDLNDLVRHLEASAARSLLVGIVTVCIAIASAGLAAAFTGRAVARPARRLAASARRISRGEFSLPPLSRGGVRELSETSGALNEMAATLTALERYAITLAEDPLSSTLNHPLPGRTGESLQVTLDRLRDSVHDRERRHRALQEEAAHDGLTGLLNRAAAVDAITRDLSRSRRDGSTLLVLFIDLDDFKTINDTYGHDMGDDALRFTADALRMATRLSDIVARFGGDEFLVAGVAADRTEVEAIARRVHDAIASRFLSIDDGEHITINSSIGIAIAESGDTAESLLRKADQALYRAKRSGGDQVAWDDPDGSRAPITGSSSPAAAAAVHTGRFR